jgi:hypothetical protein
MSNNNSPNHAYSLKTLAQNPKFAPYHLHPQHSIRRTLGRQTQVHLHTVPATNNAPRLVFRAGDVGARRVRRKLDTCDARRFFRVTLQKKEIGCIWMRGTRVVVGRMTPSPRHLDQRRTQRLSLHSAANQWSRLLTN